jgi:PEP-CTERM motif
MRSCIRANAVVLAVVSLAILGSAPPAQASIESREILKSYFQTGDVPTQDQFASLIDSAANLIDDRYLLGLKVYDPQATYLVGDTVIFNRLAAGDVVGQIAEGTATTPPAREFASWPPLDPNDPSEMDVATDFAGQYGFMGILLQDSSGQINYGYFQMGMDPAGSANPGIRVDYVVYESTPNTPITVAPVPEPGTATLCVLGLAALAGRRKTPTRR